MPRVVPSQIVAFIDEVFGWAANQTEGQGLNLTLGNAGELTGLFDLIHEIPGDLLTMGGREYATFVCSVGAIRNQLNLWQRRGDVGALVFVGGLPRLSPVALIRRALAACRDEGPAPATAELNFVHDVELRNGLRVDMGAANRALSNGEWKAATVLAGSVIEALLLWVLQQRQAEASTEVQTLARNGASVREPPTALDQRSLAEYIAAAEQLTIIAPETATQTRLAKDFRNLIHPGRAQRLGQNCDRGTALSAAAAVELVVRDLSR